MFPSLCTSTFGRKFLELHKKGQREELARWCYPVESIGDELTYMVLLTATNQLVPRSNVRPANNPLYPNFHLRPMDSSPLSSGGDGLRHGPANGLPGEHTAPATGPIKSVQDYYDVPVALPKFSPEELLGLTFLHEVDGGQRV